MNQVIIKSLRESLTEFINISSYQYVDERIEKNKNEIQYTSYQVLYKSNVCKREVHFSLIDYGKHNRLFTNLYNRDGQGHYSISLTAYLEDYCNLSNASELMLLDQYAGDCLKEKLLSFFTTVKSKLDNRFFEILKGTDWIEIPINWHGYK